jgi:outer membrane murein-binding lipoprotein Lpp
VWWFRWPPAIIPIASLWTANGVMIRAAPTTFQTHLAPPMPRGSNVKSDAFILIATLLAGFLLCGCVHMEKVQPANGESPVPENLETRNNAASLLYDVLGDEKNVGKILVVKRNSEELGRLIKGIAEAAGDDEKQLEQLAKNDRNLNLRAIQLPQGEKAARDAVAKTKERELLFSSGTEFEFNLLLTQAEALSYGWHLAKIAAENSSSPDEVQKFAAMSRGMENLYGRVVLRMQQSK